MQMEELEERTSQLQMEADGLVKAQQALYELPSSMYFAVSLCFYNALPLSLYRCARTAKNNEAKFHSAVRCHSANKCCFVTCAWKTEQFKHNE